MANEIPSSDQYTGLSRAVLQYSEAFARIVAAPAPLTDADWAPIERLVDTANFVRHGVFLTAQAEMFGWQTYKSYISKYAAGTAWEGTLRHITESADHVILELEERNTTNGKTSVANTVTIYDFTQAGKIHHLEVYVMHLRTE